MKTKQILLVVVITCISIVCMAFMNYNYDSLSRYPYQDEESRKLIKEHLNSDEIEYIIEYSISPSTFIPFIEQPRFNIYHAQEYHDLSKLLWDKSPATIVKYVEETVDYFTVDQLAYLLIHYNYTEIQYWINFHDSYNSESNLVFNAGDVTAYVDDTHTVSIRIPFNLQILNSDIPTKNGQKITIDKALQDPLTSMCNDIDQDETINSPNGCGGLEITSGYISYQDQITIWEQSKDFYGDSAIAYEFMPGHSEHQLGLAIDFDVSGISNSMFVKTSQYSWLVDNAYKYGFVQTYNDDTTETTDKLAQPYHWRYVGVGLATYLHDNNINFTDYSIEEENQSTF